MHTKAGRFLPLFLLVAALSWAETGLDAECLGRIPKRMQEFVDAGATSGVVTLVQRHGELASLEAVGFQDLETKTPMKTDTIFQIMSMTKPVTSTGIMVLMEEGRLSLLDPIEKFLPNFRYQQVKVSEDPSGAVILAPKNRSVTIRDLLTHTSGMAGGRPANAPERFRRYQMTLTEAVDFWAGIPLSFQPGARWQYSNMGMDTLGRIIEVISGQPFEEFIHDRIFEPLGMKDSFFFLPKDRHSRLASVYTWDGEKLVKAEGDIFRTGAKYPMPAGGMYSTASDMARFYQMMLNGGTYEGKRILSTPTVEVMTSLQTGDMTAGHWPGGGFALGWNLVREPVGTFRLQSIGTFGHGGAFRTYGSIDPKKDLIVIVMMQRTNVGGDRADEISAALQIAASAIVE